MTVALAPRPVKPEPRDTNFRWNALALGSDFSLFMLGLSLASAQTLIPAFAERLGAPNIVIGAIPAFMRVGWMLPAIFAANYTQSLPRKLPFILRYTLWERLPYVVMALAAFFLAERSPGLTLAILFVCLTVNTTAGGVLIPAWLDIVAKVIPTNIRGRFFAVSNGIGALLGIGGAAGVGYLLDRYGFPQGYGLCFLAAGVCMFVSFGGLALTREPPGPVKPDAMPAMAYLRRLPGLVRANPNLVRFLVAQSLVVCGGMAGGFYTVHALKDMGAPDAQVGAFTAMSMLAQTVGMLGFGWLADHGGHKRVLAMGAAASALGALAAFAAGSVVALYVTFLLVGLGIAAQNVSGMTIGLEFGPDDERPTYTAINNSSTAPFNLLAPLAGGVIADSFGFGPVFLLAAAFSAAGALALWLLVRDPRHVRA